MYQRNGVLGVAGIGGMFALLTLLVGAGRAPEPAAPPPPSAAPPVEPSPFPSPSPGPPGPGRKLLGEYFSDGRAGAEAWPGALADPDLQVVIATLPDPIDTHLDWLFDANLDALKRAFERAGYVIDRFEMPWSRDNRPAGSLEAPLPPRYTRPGALLFRSVTALPPAHSEPERAPLALLYVVGESPTGGVHRQALRAALEERRSLLAGAPECGPRAPVKIVGPVFSGSSVSLRRVLDAWQETSRQSVVLRSGTATDPGNQSTLSGRDRDFFATVHSDRTLLEVLCGRVVRPLGLEDSQVAVLKESTTQYGQATSWRCRAEGGGFVVLPFPMNISGLRAAYHAQPPPAPRADAQAPAEAPRLSLRLTAPLRPRENAPLFSEITAPALDLQLDALAHLMTHQGVRVAAILATDVRDTLFLGAEIRRRARDVQLVTFESNSLYLRADYNAALRGMLVLSTYPLLGHTLEHRHEERPSFTSGLAEGTYNATLEQLGFARGLIHYAPMGAGGEPGPNAAEGEHKPPVWITTVGRNGFLPVASVPAPPGDGYVLAAAAPDEPAKRGQRDGHGDRGVPGHAEPLAPLNFGVTIVLGLVLALGAPSLARREGPSPGSAPEASASWPALRRHVEAASLALHRELYTGLLFAAVSSLYLPLAVTVVRQRWNGHWSDRLLGAFCLAVGLCVAWFAGLTTARGWSLARASLDAGRRYALHRDWRSRKDQYLWWIEIVARTAVALAGLAYVLLVVLFLAWIARLDALSFRLFAVRAQEIDGGVSPLLPLAFGAAGFGCWSVWHLMRIRALQAPSEYERSWPPGSRWAQERLGGRVRAVRNRLFLTLPEPWTLGVMLVLAAVGAWLWPRFACTIESMAFASVEVGGPGCTPFEWLLRVVVLGSLGTTAWGVLRFALVWGALRAFLEDAGRTPLRTAFERLPEPLSRLGRLTLWPRDDATARTAATEQLRLLQRLYAANGAAVETVLEPPLRRRLALAMRPRSARAGRTLILVRSLVETLWRAEPNPEQVRALEAGLASGDAKKADPGQPVGEAVRRAYAGPQALWLRAAEEYLASHVVEYVESVLRHLGRLAAFLLATLLLTTVLLSSYPFQPQALVKLCFSFVLAATVVTLLWVTGGANRNDMLSRIAHTDPGRVTWDAGFVGKLVAFGVAPLLTLVSSEFPWFRSVFFAWVDPLLRALTKS